MKGQALERLCEIMATLRGPEGCAWDRKQSLSSLKPYLIEETYETIDAIADVEEEPSAKNRQQHLEELGDLLLQIVFQAQIQSEQKAFDMGDVCEVISQKLIRRHPHIFGDAANFDSDSNPHWERIKAEERANKGDKRESIFDGIPRSLPAMTRAHRVNQKAAEVGFDWPTADGALEQLKSEVVEFEEVMHGSDSEKIEHELGDIMLACLDLARHLKRDPEHILQKATRRFEARFRFVENAVKKDGKVLTETSLDEMNTYWGQAKAHLSSQELA